MSKPINIHAGHRDRVRAVVEKSGLNSIPPYQALEYILFHGIPYKDTKPIAMDLLKKFGTLRSTFNASVEDLMEIKNMTRNAALLLRSYSSIYDTLFFGEEDKPDITCNTLLPYLKQLFTIDTTERLILLCLDNKGKFLRCETLYEGSYDHITISTKDVLKSVLNCKASAFLLAHNHPSDDLKPSDEDEQNNNLLGTLTESLGIEFIDHFIIGDRFAFSCGLQCRMAIDENSVYPLYIHGIGDSPI